ncbi:hypothetical protein VPH35_117194 [Triticum aestivum]
MHNALLKLWEMFEDSRSAKRKVNLEGSLIHHLTEEKKNLDANYDRLVEDYAVLMNLVEARGSVIRNLKMNHLEEKEKLITEENVQLNVHMSGPKKGHENLIKRGDELKLQVADQLKALEKNKEKLKLIHDILKE